MYMLANDFDYEEEKISIGDDVEENDKVETPNVKEEKVRNQNG